MEGQVAQAVAMEEMDRSWCIDRKAIALYARGHARPIYRSIALIVAGTSGSHSLLTNPKDSLRHDPLRTLKNNPLLCNRGPDIG